MATIIDTTEKLDSSMLNRIEEMRNVIDLDGKDVTELFINLPVVFTTVLINENPADTRYIMIENTGHAFMTKSRKFIVNTMMRALKAEIDGYNALSLSITE